MGIFHDSHVGQAVATRHIDVAQFGNTAKDNA
jgi:alpha-D-ribose 1-methylphosphonate 5-triphosphate synthase subunit PhnL